MKPPPFLVAAIGIIAVQLSGGLPGPTLDDCWGKELFSQRIAPILQQHCFGCHNQANRKGDFSLQSADDAFADGHIEPGDSASSHLVDLVAANDGTAAMPKDASPLSKDEVDALKRWIDEGAKWPEGLELREPVVKDFDWWSYRPIVRPKVPEFGIAELQAFELQASELQASELQASGLKDGWVQNPIDAFILRSLNANSLRPSPPADRRTLIRRVTYDLTGLPPSPDEVRDFVQDQDPQAYEKLVNRLLDSKHYGEHWARHWLDVVKYGDTCGYDKDKLRKNAWPYRDYVIRSFNDDKPYSRFVQEQIAGDALFAGQADGILGLGFIAAGPWDFIGHVEVPESKMDGKVARNLDRDDMVSNAINTFCSMTVQCARCHNHKFDPISQDDYYAMQSIFAAVDKADRIYSLPPKIIAQRLQLNDDLAKANQAFSRIDREIAKAGGQRLRDLQANIKRIAPTLKSDRPIQYGYHSQISQDQEAEKWTEVDFGGPFLLDRIVIRPCEDDYAGIGSGFGFPVRYKVSVKDADGKWSIVYDQTKSDITNPGLAALQIPNINRSAQVVRMTATKLAERKGDYIFAIAELQAFDSAGVNVAKAKRVRSLDSIEAAPRWGRSNLTDGKWPESVDQAAAAQLATWKKEEADLMSKARTPDRIERRKNASKRIKQITDSLKKLPNGQMVYAATTVFKPQGNFKPTNGKLRPIHVLHRGNIGQPKGIAGVGFIPLPSDDGKIEPFDDESQRRAAFAKWLTDKEHPLVWRSIVNRIWQYHFGSGIVATPNDFGRMGATPTHPELLDWLATEFRDGGQTMKRIHRLIVTSSVYQQQSVSNPNNEQRDKDNRYLWRMNRRRLSAEEVRDSVLSVSGVLDRKMGGPGFYLFALERTQHSPHYEYHKFDPREKATHRRSVYRFIARSQPDPWMTTFDCADSSQSTPRRNETLTSLQALSLMNSRFNLAMSELFADSIQADGDQLEKQLFAAFRRVTQRDPKTYELDELVTYAQKHGLPNTCRFLFNLSEFVFVD